MSRDRALAHLQRAQELLRNEHQGMGFGGRTLMSREYRKREANNDLNFGGFLPMPSFLKITSKNQKIKEAWQKEFDKHNDSRIHKSTLWRTGFYDDYLRFEFKKQGWIRSRSVHNTSERMPEKLDKDWLMLVNKAVDDTWDTDTTTDWVTGTEAEQKIVKQFIENQLKENQISDLTKKKYNPSYKFLNALKSWYGVLERSVAAYKKRKQKQDNEAANKGEQ